MSAERESLFASLSVRDREHFTGLRKQASRGGRAIDGGAAFTPVRDNVLLALLDSYEDTDPAPARRGAGGGESCVTDDYAEIIRKNAYHAEWCASGGPPGGAEELCDCNRRHLIAALEALERACEPNPSVQLHDWGHAE